MQLHWTAELRVLRQFLGLFIAVLLSILLTCLAIAAWVGIDDITGIVLGNTLISHHHQDIRTVRRETKGRTEQMRFGQHLSRCSDGSLAIYHFRRANVRPAAFLQTDSVSALVNSSQGLTLFPPLPFYQIV